MCCPGDAEECRVEDRSERNHPMQSARSGGVNIAHMALVPEKDFDGGGFPADQVRDFTPLEFEISRRVYELNSTIHKRESSSEHGKNPWLAEKSSVEHHKRA